VNQQTLIESRRAISDMKDAWFRCAQSGDFETADALEILIADTEELIKKMADKYNLEAT